MLEWYTFSRSQQDAGELLACFELIPSTDCPAFALPPRRTVREEVTKSRKQVRPLPRDIRPELALTRIDVLAWGLRRLARYQLLQVDSPSVQFECGGVTVETPALKSLRDSPNFDACLLSFEIFLPKKEKYAPPLNIRVYDHRKFGRKPLVGVHTITSVSKHRVDAAAVAIAAAAAQAGTNGQSIGGTAVLAIDAVGAKGGVPTATQAKPMVTGGKAELFDDTIDWWSKFFASHPAAPGYENTVTYTGDRLSCFHNELEQTVSLDLAIKAFALVRGKEEEQLSAGVFKGDLAVFGSVDGPGVGDLWKTLPSSAATTCIVRVYVVRALDLPPMDLNGRADA